jgi:pimeloyl-ACP methyl ester carboxylesterase
MIHSARPKSRVTPLVLAILCGCAALSPARSVAQRKSTPTPDPEPVLVTSSAGTTEVGTLSGTQYRIDIPAAWNHSLVVYFHGYSEGVYSYRADGPLNEQTQPIFDRGYAIIQSAYSASGWALAEAYPETEQLRQYFLKKYAQPAEGKKAAKQIETIVAGGSMGGALVVAALELNPKPYSGGLDLCGSVGPTDIAFQRRFAWRAAFDFYFPNLMPPLVPTPPDFRETKAQRDRIMEALKANPTAAAALHGLMSLHTDRDIADDIVYFTYVIADMQRRAGGNPFDNRNFLYTDTNPTSTASDIALNDGVRRYAAEPAAREYLLHHYTPTGHLNHPMLALHTAYDPRIPGSTLAIYGEQVAIAGFSHNLVQQYVHRDGHCAFSPEEVGRSFDELVQWIHTGRRPIPGVLPPAQHTSAALSSPR